MENHNETGRWLIVAFLILFIAVAFLFTKAHTQETPPAPDLTNADFIADQMFERWYRYAVRKDPERALASLTMIETAAKRAGVEDYGKMVAVAWYESRFNPNALSKSHYYRGMFQLGKHFKKPMADMGLDYYNESDRLYFGMLKYKNAGLKPWSVRSRARRDYNIVMAAERTARGITETGKQVAKP
jgi:hypothetical protein